MSGLKGEGSPHGSTGAFIVGKCHICHVHRVVKESKKKILGPTHLSTLPVATASGSRGPHFGPALSLLPPL